MKTEKNNLDELFRASLGNLTEQPSRGLWHRISRQMLLKEVTRFNFTNVPATWVALPVAAIIIASVAVFTFNNPFQSEDSSIADQIFPPTVENSITIPQTNSGNVENDNSTNIASVESEITDRSQPEEIQEQTSGLNSTPINQQELSKADALTGAEISTFYNNNSNQTDLHTIQSVDEDQGGIASQESIAVQTAPVIIPALADELTVEADDFQKQIRDSEISSEERSLDYKTVEISGLVKLESNEIQPLTMKERGQMRFLPFELTDFESRNRRKDVDEQSHSTGKVQSLSSQSHSIKYFLRGTYKPPKREFQTNALKSQRKKTSHLVLTGYVAPEITEYARMASTSRERSFAGGLALGYNTPTYVIEGGIEFSYIYDLGDYMVNMETYDSIGFYQSVNGFTVDPNNPGNLIYDIQEVGVWDSVQHHSHQQTQNSYTYLQFPVMFGYKAMNHGNFSAYIKAGPSFSVMLNKNEPGLEFYQSGATINSVENYSLPRLTANVQLLVSLRLQLQVSEKLGIMTEPVYRYYLGTVYEINTNNEKLSNPFGIGLRAGVFYTF